MHFAGTFFTEDVAMEVLLALLAIDVILMATTSLKRGKRRR